MSQVPSGCLSNSDTHIKWVNPLPNTQQGGLSSGPPVQMGLPPQNSVVNAQCVVLGGRLESGQLCIDHYDAHSTASMNPPQQQQQQHS